MSNSSHYRSRFATRSVAATLMGRDRPRKTQGHSGALPRGATAALLVIATTNIGFAQQNTAKPRQTEDSVVASPGPDTPPEGDQPGDARALYNQSLSFLISDVDRAERLLTRARQDSGTDGPVRFRATYNMGWVEVKRADAQLQEDPQQALAHLRSAAGWFRDAIRLRPDHSDSRHNLEVVLRRALQLADSLAKQDGRDLVQRLDELIERQRKLLGEVREVVEQVARIDDPNAADQFRSQFRAVGVQQRTILSDGQALADSAREELDALQSTSQEQATPEQQLRAAQLANLLHYMNRASQRMGQARTQMRRRQGQRAYRRASVSLSELKRARDQLRDPVEVLGVLLADAVTLGNFTAQLAASSSLAPDSPSASPPPPAWLTRSYLEETQESVTERTAELEARLLAGLKEQDNQPLGPAAPGEEPADPKTERFLSLVRQAVPWITEGKQAFQAALDALRTEQVDVASQRQAEALVALNEARERFLDLRRLIELTYAVQTQVRQLLSLEILKDKPENIQDQSDPSQDQQVQQQRDRLIAVTHQLQQKNLERSERLDQLIDENIAELPPADTASDSPTAGPAGHETEQEDQSAQVRRQRLGLAKQLLDNARGEMTASGDSLDKIRPAEGSDEPPSLDQPPLDEALGSVDRALEHLASLRRLFFSIVEHLRETAQRQAQLNDETEQVAALSEAEEIAQKVGPLIPRQLELQQLATQIAEALSEQANQIPTTAAEPQGGDPQQAKQLQQLQQQAGEKLQQAAQLVQAAGIKMMDAKDDMAQEQPDLEPARDNQDKALEDLIQALALLVPPEQPPQNQDDQQKQQRQDQGQDQEKQDEPQPQVGLDPARMLQAVRDREAQRRKENAQRKRASIEPVEKDW